MAGRYVSGNVQILPVAILQKTGCLKCSVFESFRLFQVFAVGRFLDVQGPLKMKLWVALKRRPWEASQKKVLGGL